VKVAREASMQSRRVWLPDVMAVATFAELAARPGAVRAERGGAPLAAELPPLVLVGPEGGWSVTEREVVPGEVGLGPTVLRAETAAVATGVLLANGRNRAIAEKPCHGA
jgi:RsmE family RNA methyltransferase